MNILRRKTNIILLAVTVLISVILSGVTAYGTEEEKVADYNGKVIGVQTSVLYETFIEDRCPDSEIMYFTMPNDMILALNGGKVDAYLVEEVGYFAQKANHPELTTLKEYAGICEAAVVIGENPKQERLLQEMNQFIADREADGTLEQMYDYWIANFDADTCVCKEVTLTGENGELVVGIEGGYEPFSFISYGVDSGYDVDFVNRFCEEYGYLPVYHQVPFESIAPGAESGKYDLGMNIILSDERQGEAVLSDVYYDCPIVLVVPGENDESVGIIQAIKNSFYKTFIKENRWTLFAEGAGITMLITLSAIIFGTLLGFIVYMICRKGNPIANKIAGFFNWLIEGMPTVVLLMILYYIVFGSTRLNGIIVSIVGFTLIFACCMYDMLEIGFNALGKGQVEAAKALGYTDRQSFFKVLLPQAARHFLPIYRNDVVTLIKETSVAGYIAIFDLTKAADLVRARTYEAFFPLIFTAIIYFILAAIMIAVIKKVEFNINPKRRSKEKILQGIQENE